MSFKKSMIYQELVLLSLLTWFMPLCRSDCQLIAPVNKPSESELKRETQLLEAISPLKGKVFKTVDTVDPAHYTYLVSICDKIKGENDSIGAIQFISKDKAISLGRYDSADIMGGTGWILLTYYGGSNYGTHCNGSERITKIMITCNPNILADDLKILEERRSSSQNCFYLFEFSSKVACINIYTSYFVKPSHGLSSGSVFCILFFTFVIVYLVCGFLYKRIIVGAKGLEQIPNYTFWREFGNLQADGCDFICRCGPRIETQAYRGIDEHLKREEERDDQLLNM